MLRVISYLMFLAIFSLCFSQERTVGTILYNENAFDGYTLFAPLNATNTYLINNCGQVVNEWSSSYSTATAVYLLDDGSLIREGAIENKDIPGAGGGGIIERFDWDGNLIWSFVYNDENVRSHHDFQVMPNGNVLVLAWEVISSEDAISAGRNPDLLDENLWPEKIIEVKPGIEGSADEIVWEWRAWDHIIQDYDETKDNYGVVEENIEKIDLNYVKSNSSNADWLHANSLDYNPDLDQILISVLNFDEVWIIDHGITTEEAKSDKGDLLFRWGNPKTYKNGDESDQLLFGQHNAHWIDPELPDGNKIMIFNNGSTRQGDKYTSIVKINPVYDNGYPLAIDGNYLPPTYDWEYTSNPPTDFYSRFVSGAQQLSNGNILINSGAFGTFFEIDMNEELVWEYINPVSSSGIVSQGESVIDENNNGTNVVFRATKLSPDFVDEFISESLNNVEFLEGMPIPVEPCVVLNSPEKIGATYIYPNPAKENVFLHNAEGKFIIYNLQGNIVKRGFLEAEGSNIDISQLKPGIHFLKIEGIEIQRFLISK